MALPKFTGDEKCPKDGTDRPARVLHKAGTCQTEPLEHLHLTCGVCQYEWCVAPADTA